MARIKRQPMAHIGKAAKAQIIWRIAVYIRLSREDKNKESGKSDDSDSVVNQQKILTEYLEKYFEGQYEVVDFYVDASNIKRHRQAKKKSRPRTYNVYRQFGRVFDLWHPGVRRW